MKPNARAQYLMADLFDSVRAAVTARQAAERYGLEFDRSGRRARCIWHSPDRHPSLTFKGSYCRCFACNNGGSSIDLVAKLFGLSPLEAARKLDADFALGLADRPLARPSGPSRAQMRREAEEWRRTRWAFLCDVEREASAVLERFPPAETSWKIRVSEARWQRLERCRSTLNGCLSPTSRKQKPYVRRWWDVQGTALEAYQAEISSGLVSFEEVKAMPPKFLWSHTCG